jgi:hypothetical protein
LPGAVSAFRGAEVLVEFEDLDSKVAPGTSVQVEIDTTGGEVAGLRNLRPDSALPEKSTANSGALASKAHDSETRSILKS